MTSSLNPFTKTASEYSNEQLVTIINSSQDYSPKLAEACLAEASIRELQYTSHKALPPEKTFLYLITVRKKLSEGIQINECERFLIDEGLREDQVALILKKAKIPALELQNYSKSSVDDNALKWFGSIMVVLSISLKIIIWYFKR